MLWISFFFSIFKDQTIKFFLLKLPKSASFSFLWVPLITRFIIKSCARDQRIFCPKIILSRLSLFAQTSTAATHRIHPTWVYHPDQHSSRDHQKKQHQEEEVPQLQLRIKIIYTFAQISTIQKQQPIQIVFFSSWLYLDVILLWNLENCDKTIKLMLEVKLFNNYSFPFYFSLFCTSIYPFLRRTSPFTQIQFSPVNTVKSSPIHYHQRCFTHFEYDL